MIKFLLKLNFPTLTFLYAIFFLGAVPLPPVTSRPFLAEGTGVSQFHPLNPVSQDLALLGKTAPGIAAAGALLLLLLYWTALSRTTFQGVRPLWARLVQFFVLLLVGFIAADFSRELTTPNFADYLYARADWIRKGASPGYPKWPTVRLKQALINRETGEIMEALSGVTTPEFGKIPEYPPLSSACKTVLGDRIEGSTGLVVEQPMSGNFPLACRLLSDIIPNLGHRDVKDPSTCLYGPAVKVLHALDRQGLSCTLANLPGAPPADTVCPAFEAAVGTQAFKFCSAGTLAN